MYIQRTIIMSNQSEKMVFVFRGEKGVTFLSDPLRKYTNNQRLKPQDGEVSDREVLIDLLNESDNRVSDLENGRRDESWHPTQASDSARLILAIQRERDDLLREVQSLRHTCDELCESLDLAQMERDELEGYYISAMSRNDDLTRGLRMSAAGNVRY